MVNGWKDSGRYLSHIKLSARNFHSQYSFSVTLLQPQSIISLSLLFIDYLNSFNNLNYKSFFIWELLFQERKFWRMGKLIDSFLPLVHSHGLVLSVPSKHHHIYEPIGFPIPARPPPKLYKCVASSECISHDRTSDVWKSNPKLCTSFLFFISIIFP